VGRTSPESSAVFYYNEWHFVVDGWISRNSPIASENALNQPMLMNHPVYHTHHSKTGLEWLPEGAFWIMTSAVVSMSHVVTSATLIIKRTALPLTHQTNLQHQTCSSHSPLSSWLPPLLPPLRLSLGDLHALLAQYTLTDAVSPCDKQQFT
jgi:hypothetical protein